MPWSLCTVQHNCQFLMSWSLCTGEHPCYFSTSQTHPNSSQVKHALILHKSNTPWFFTSQTCPDHCVLSSIPVTSSQVKHAPILHKSNMPRSLCPVQQLYHFFTSQTHPNHRFLFIHKCFTLMPINHLPSTFLLLSNPFTSFLKQVTHTQNDNQILIFNHALIQI